MATLTRNCPHCLTQKMAFIPFGEYIWQKSSVSGRTCVTALRCAGCGGGYIIESNLQTTTTPMNSHGNIEEEKYLKITKEYPRSTGAKCPEYLPENIKNFYLQAHTSLLHKSFDASSIMSRKCLETSVKILDPAATGNLYSRIENLHKRGLITESLKDWAHIVRESGNGAAHEELPVSEEYATELLSFSELLLMYIFTLPGMINAKKSNSA